MIMATTTKTILTKRALQSTTLIRATAPSIGNRSLGSPSVGAPVASFFHASACRNTVVENENVPNWADPSMRQYKFWNREEAKEKEKYSFLIEISPESVTREARIFSLSDPKDEACAMLHDNRDLPLGASLVGVGTELEHFDSAARPNVLFVSPTTPSASEVLPQLLRAFPTIQWVHCRSAGIDFVSSDQLCDVTTANNVQMTNAKGQFSSTLAEYAIMACSYFAKDLPRLIRQKEQRIWDKFDVQELRGKTMGIVGYGDIGRAVAKVATVYGMRVVALRRHPFLSKNDPLCNVVYGRDAGSLVKLMSESDYIVCSAPSTVETRGMVNAKAFEHVKQDAVFVNLGRGPVVDEQAMIQALKSGRLKGAALDVFAMEPLDASSELWDLPNTLISPHNMDQTSTFMHEATEFFLKENLPRFLCGEDLLNPVDPKLGY